VRWNSSATAYSRRVILKQLRNDVAKMTYSLTDGADSLRMTAVSISRLSVLVATVAVAALGVAVVALLYAVNREAGRETNRTA